MKKTTLVILLFCAISACNNKPKHSVNIVNVPPKNNIGQGYNMANNAQQIGGDTHTKASPRAIINSNDPKLKAMMERGAIKGPGDLYFMPIGKDRGGCTYYSSFSPGKVTLTVVYYRKADGNFTTNVAESNCS